MKRDYKSHKLDANYKFKVVHKRLPPLFVVGEWYVIIFKLLQTGRKQKQTAFPDNRRAWMKPLPKAAKDSDFIWSAVPLRKTTVAEVVSFKICCTYPRTRQNPDTF